MTQEIRGTLPSPRVENSTVFWYAGDTVKLPLRPEITDILGYTRELTTGDAVCAELYGRHRQLIKQYTFSYDDGDIEDGVLTLNIDATDAAAFTPGNYTLKLTVEFACGEGEEADNKAIAVIPVIVE